MKFKDINYKISDVEITKRYYNEIPFYRCIGISIVENGNKKIEYIPFSGQDALKDISKEKAISELYERLTWINIYKNSDIKGYFDTIGFSAHVDLDASLNNSILEVFERHLFQETVNNIIFQKPLKVENYKRGITYSYEVNFDKKIFYISVYFEISQNMIIFSMGKEEKLIDAKFNAYLESRLVDEAFSNRDIIKPDNLSYLELVNFLEISLKLEGFADEIFDDDKEVGVNLFEDYSFADEFKLFDVTNLRPKNLPNKRVVTCFVKDKQILNTILDNGGIQYAVKI